MQSLTKEQEAREEREAREEQSGGFTASGSYPRPDVSLHVHVQPVYLASAMHVNTCMYKFILCSLTEVPPHVTIYCIFSHAPT